MAYCILFSMENSVFTDTLKDNVLLIESAITIANKEKRANTTNVSISVNPLLVLLFLNLFMNILNLLNSLYFLDNYSKMNREEYLLLPLLSVV